MIKTDVLIIGGGIIGCSIAYYLVKEGVKTVLVEKDDIASGASGACDGFIFLQSKKSGIHLEMALKSAGIYANLTAELGCDLEYRRCGGMIFAESQEELSYLCELSEKQQKNGLEVKILSEAETRSKVPGLASHPRGATYCPQDAQVNPILTTLALAGAASKKGARIFTGTAISEMEVVGRRQGKGRIIANSVAAKDKIKADFVINAAGAEASGIAGMAGFDLPIIPRRGQILVTEPLPKVLDCLLMSAGYLAAKFCRDDDMSIDCGVTLEQTAAGNILIGSTREFVGYNKRTTYEGMTSIAANAIKFFPQFKNFKIIRSFAGLRPYTPDGLPVLGYVNGIRNLIIASGHEGDGIALAPITGKLVAELVVSGAASIDISELSPNRFAAERQQT